MIRLDSLFSTSHNLLVPFRRLLILVAESSKDMIWGYFQLLTGLHKSLLLRQHLQELGVRRVRSTLRQAHLAHGELAPAWGRGCACLDLPLIVLKDQLIDKLVCKVRVFHNPLPLLLNLLVDCGSTVLGASAACPVSCFSLRGALSIERLWYGWFTGRLFFLLFSISRMCSSELLSTNSFVIFCVIYIVNLHLLQTQLVIRAILITRCLLLFFLIFFLFHFLGCLERIYFTFLQVKRRT